MISQTAYRIPQEIRRVGHARKVMNEGIRKVVGFTLTERVLKDENLMWLESTGR